MKLLNLTLIGISLLNFGSASAISTKVCSSSDYKVKLNIYNDKQGFFYNQLPSGDHQQFGVSSSLQSEKLVYSNYSTSIVFDSPIIQKYNTVEIFQNDVLVSKKDMKCIDNQVFPTKITKTKFSKKLKQILSHYTEIESLENRDLIFFIKDSNNFDLNFYSTIMAGQLTEIGDWFNVDLNESQVDKVKNFLNANYKELLNTIKDEFDVKLVGYLFARDWYYGSGRIGIVLKKEYHLMILPVGYEYYSFGDDQLDYTY